MIAHNLIPILIIMFKSSDNHNIISGAAGIFMNISNDQMSAHNLLNYETLEHFTNKIRCTGLKDIDILILILKV
jgi:hypothetical protein